MKLTLEDLPGYLACVGAPPERLEKVRRAYEEGRRDLARTFVAKNDEGRVVGVLNVNDNGLMIAYGVPTPALVPEAVARLREIGASRAGLRITDPSAAFREAMANAGFRDLGERIEYQAPVEELLDDANSPLHWRPAGPDGAAMLAAVAVQDPHGKDERESPNEVLRSFAEMRADPECFQIGSLDGEDVAFVCAQVAPRDGWSRIAYMGLVPSARGKGLGRWLHRHGFSMIKAQGGTLYHGGTAASNKAMLALFELHGCREFKRMTEFDWHADQS